MRDVVLPTEGELLLVSSGGRELPAQKVAPISEIGCALTRCEPDQSPDAQEQRHDRMQREYFTDWSGSLGGKGGKNA